MLIIDFALQKNPNDPIFKSVKGIAEQVYKTRDLRKLESIFKDLNAWAKGFPSNDLIELDRLLSNQLQETLSKDIVVERIIKKALSKGAIADDDEFQCIQEILNDMAEGDAYFQYYQSLEKLLFDYKS
jgi:hypothetical protein